MRYRITHTTNYSYNRTASLEPHVLRLRPRCDGCQTLLAFNLKVEPQPSGLYHVVDLDGNSIIQVWFQAAINYLCVEVVSEVETHRINPFDFLLEPWATKLPIDYPASLFSSLQPYFQSYGLPTAIDPVVTQLTQEIYQAKAGDTVEFLTELNQRIYQNCEYTMRETGTPLPAGLTWTQKRGSCRDLTVLFIEACRAVNLAARFVSGYQEGDLNLAAPELHAWAEVYLPGAGWRGYDPTHGLAVSDRHITLVAAPLPMQAAPISGSFRGVGIQSQMQYQVSIQSF